MLDATRPGSLLALIEEAWRRSRRRWFTVASLVVGGAAVGVALYLLLPGGRGPAPSKHGPVGVTHISQARILSIATRSAAEAGDPAPTLIQHSALTTRAQANLVDSGDVVPGDNPSYLIAERGQFLSDGPRPPGSLVPAGPVMTMVVDATTGKVTDGGLADTYPDLAKLGPVTTDLRAPSVSYRVVAPVLRARSASHPLACLTVLADLPPGGCSGVRVSGYRFPTAPGTQHFRGGGWQTPTLRLSGTWTGHVLHVEHVSLAPHRQPTPSGVPGCTARTTYGRARILAHAIGREAARLDVIETEACHAYVSVLVPVADLSTVSTFRKQFGPSVFVRGWLQPERRDGG